MRCRDWPKVVQLMGVRAGTGTRVLDSGVRCIPGQWGNRSGCGGVPRHTVLLSTAGRGCGGWLGEAEKAFLVAEVARATVRRSECKESVPQQGQGAWAESRVLGWAVWSPSVPI